MRPYRCSCDAAQRSEVVQRHDRSGRGEDQAERGEFNVSLDTIVKIAVALEISAAALLERARL
jgi:hypothetical protein